MKKFGFFALFLGILFVKGNTTSWVSYTVLEHGPEDLTVIAGETARFSCDLNLAARKDAIWWLFETSDCFLYISRNEKLRRTCGINMHHYRIEIDSIHHIYTIEIDNVSEEDAGKYICKNESSILDSALLVVLPRLPDPTPVAPLPGDCSQGVCCEVSYYPTGLAPSTELEAQATCIWTHQYSNIDIHVHLYCDGQEIRGTDKVLLADRAIGKLEPNRQTGCSNFTCNLEIVGESKVKESCSINTNEPPTEVVLKAEPEINFVEEGLNAIFFCHINNAHPTSGSFRWYIIHSHFTSVNSISSKPITSTTGYYGKLELSTVRLDDDFVTVQCYFDPDSRTNYTSKSNPAVLRVLRRSPTQVSCYTNSEYSLLECTDLPDDQGKDDGFKIWPLSIKEWIFIGTTLVLLFIVILLCRPIVHKPSHHRRSLEHRRERRPDSDVNVTDTTNPPDTRLPRERYEYLAERYYDEPYSLLRNIRNFPRRLRHRVIHRHYLRSARQAARQSNASQTDSANVTYGAIDPNSIQSVRLRERAVSRPSETTILPDDISPRNSSDYDILDANTMAVFHPSPPSSSPPSSPPASPPSSPPASPVDDPSDPEYATSTHQKDVSETPSAQRSRSNGPSTSKKPRLGPKPLSTKPSTEPPQIPTISADVDSHPASETKEPHYVNINNDYASPLTSPVETAPQTRGNNDGYLQPIQERTDYQTIC